MVRRAELLAELRSYVGLTDEDAALLARFRPMAAPNFSAIADDFYAVIRMHAGAYAVLKDEEQARRLHASLQVWLGELLSGTYDQAYVGRHARIGEVHVRVGLDLRYVVAAMSRVRVALQHLASDALLADPEVSLATRMAIARICDLDLAILLESYKDDLVGRLESSARQRASGHPVAARRSQAPARGRAAGRGRRVARARRGRPRRHSESQGRAAHGLRARRDGRAGHLRAAVRGPRILGAGIPTGSRSWGAGRTRGGGADALGQDPDAPVARSCAPRV